MSDWTAARAVFTTPGKFMLLFSTAPAVSPDIMAPHLLAYGFVAGHFARQRQFPLLIARCYSATMVKPGPIFAKPLSVLLKDVFSEAYAKQGFAARELVTRWAEIAGPEVAACSEPLKIQWPRPVEGQPQEPATLVLRVEGPTALEIQHSSDVILERVNRFFGWSAVGRLALRQAPLSRRAAPAGSSAPDPNAVAENAEKLSAGEDAGIQGGLGPARGPNKRKFDRRPP